MEELRRVAVAEIRHIAVQSAATSRRRVAWPAGSTYALPMSVSRSFSAAQFLPEHRVARLAAHTEVSHPEAVIKAGAGDLDFALFLRAENLAEGDEVLIGAVAEADHRLRVTVSVLASMPIGLV